MKRHGATKLASKYLFMPGDVNIDKDRKADIPKKSKQKSCNKRILYHGKNLNLSHG